MLRSRKSRREDPLDIRLPDPVVTPSDGLDPEHQALLVDSVGLAMLVVLEALEPAERLAFVLHDMFAVPFADIAIVLERSPAATRQLASRARRRVQGMNPAPPTDVSRQEEIVSAFLAASRDGDFEALLELLDPDVLLRADTGVNATQVIRGAREVAGRAVFFQQFGYTSVRALVNGAAGIVSIADGQPRAVLGFNIADDRIVEMNILADPKRLSQLNLQIALD
jgi:RNA polymerase sigma-70 factor (ECF subfamily)